MNKILIIEDDEAIAEIEKDYLENCGYEADIVYDGETGLKIGLDGNYSLILLDLMLPKMDDLPSAADCVKSLTFRF